jgi:hypothetical protein
MKTPKMPRHSKRIPLPRTPEQYDALVARIAKVYKLTDLAHATATIGSAIAHLPNEQAWTTMEYLGGTVLNNLAKQVAFHRGQIVRHESEVLQLVTMLQSDPANQQARDALQRAIDQGSKFAKDELEKLGITPVTPTETPAVAG